MVTKWIGFVCTNYSRGNFKQIMLSNNICFTIQVFYVHVLFFVHFGGDIQMKLRTLIKVLLGSSLNDRISSGGKANIGNPKANRGCPPSTVYHTQKSMCKTKTKYQDRVPSYWEVQRYAKGMPIQYMCSWAVPIYVRKSSSQLGISWSLK